MNRPQISHATSFRHQEDFLTSTYFSSWCSYAKTSSSDTSAVPISSVLAVSFYHACVSLQRQRVSIAKWLAHWAYKLQVEGSNLAYAALYFLNFLKLFDPGKAEYLLLLSYN